MNDQKNKNKLDFLKIEGLTPLSLGFVTGFYPFVFFLSNNFYAVNSVGHIAYFLAFFVGVPVLLFTLLVLALSSIKKIAKYRKQILFVSIIFITAFFLSFAATLLIKKKILLAVLVISILLSFKLFDRFKKLLILISIITLVPLFKLGYKVYDYYQKNTWIQPSDSIEEVVFKTKPNIYMIQPDGYVSRETMEDALYNYENSFYDWLSKEDFKIYKDFRSNYPASLNSNASLFSMQHHYFGSTLMPDFEMPYARECISGDNPVIRIFKNNGYHTSFVVEDEYFQQNKCDQLYDYTNISVDEIPYFSKGDNLQQDVLSDLKSAISLSVEKPRFFFVEKCVPHHVHFFAEGDRIKKERLEYLEKIEEVNIWLKQTINLITEKDPHALIIVLADHGGWVGMNDYGEMFSTQKEAHIASIFSNICAIKWNGLPYDEFDEGLTSNVNVFRTLFSVLSENKSYLNNLEKDESYNLNNEGYFKEVVKLINDDGTFTYQKLKEAEKTSTK